MKNSSMLSLSRYLLFTGLIIQLAYIVMTPFTDLSITILVSTALILTVGYIQLTIAKKELNNAISEKELTWIKKRAKLQQYYNDDNNVDKSFSECLSKIKLEETHNERIAKILDNYQSNNKKFKIKLNRKSENRLNKFLQD